MDHKEIILASSSPRRRELLSKAGLDFKVVASDADESFSGDAREKVAEIAARKARSVYENNSDCAVIGADTMVWIDGRALGKPRDLAEAEEMLRALSGREHYVYTGVCVICGGLETRRTVRTGVEFKEISECELSEYLSTGDSLDKAGAYGIQGKARAFVKKFDGGFDNVMGLPVDAVINMLEEAGYGDSWK